MHRLRGLTCVEDDFMPGSCSSERRTVMEEPQWSDAEEIRSVGLLSEDSDIIDEDAVPQILLADSDSEAEALQPANIDTPKKRRWVSTSEEEDEPAYKRSRIVSGRKDSDSGYSSGGPDPSHAARIRELKKALFGSDSESEDEEAEVTGFNQKDLEGDKRAKRRRQKRRQKSLVSQSASDEGVDCDRQGSSFVSDFDRMLARRKALNSRRRKHLDGANVVKAMITKMKEAAEEDRTLNSRGKPALTKLLLLPHVVRHLKKQELKELLIDSDIMSAIKDWISPLPDRSLPALQIRQELLQVMQELSSVSQEALKHSGIGRAVLLLYQHPKESRSNKDLALRLIKMWSASIFGVITSFRQMTREERQQTDLVRQTPHRR